MHDVPAVGFCNTMIWRTLRPRPNLMLVSATIIEQVMRLYKTVARDQRISELEAQRDDLSLAE